MINHSVTVIVGNSFLKSSEIKCLKKAKKKPRRETELLKIFHTFTNLFLSEKVGAQ
jgi:hypothetical protein